MKRSAVHLVGCMLLLGACSTSGQSPGVGNADPDAGLTASDGGAGRAAIGAACRTDGDCPDGLFCDEEISDRVPVDGAPGGQVDRSLFPGGSCSPRPLAPYDPDAGTSCDLAGAQASQGCGKDGTCVLEWSDPDVVVSCRAICEPSADASGCERDGYTCSFDLHACIEGCNSDAECRLLNLDTNADGVADALGYDSKSKSVCDAATARCTHPGGTSQPGAACTGTDECEPDGECILAGSRLAGAQFPGGFCSKVGCDVPGRECGDSASECVSLRSLSGDTPSALVCLTSCRVGSEPVAQQMGPDGHGAGCRTGYRCQYNGGAGAGSGVCVGGEYNDVKLNNIGSACEFDRDCYSPYGYGACLLLSVGDVLGSTGICSLMDCNAPGLPQGPCGTGNACIGLQGDVAFCVRECQKASECAEGSACADDDADVLTPSICFPACFTDEECRPAEACQLGASGAGQCVAMPVQGR